MTKPQGLRTRRPPEEAVHDITVQKLTAGRTGFYFRAVLLAVAGPTRPWDLPHQWRAISLTGAIEVNGPIEAARRARRYAEALAPAVVANWLRVVGQ